MAAPVRDQSHDITPEQEFWGHCSNLQAWVENDYDTRILMSNISFPLLRVLSKAGDPKARKVYKEEIALRLETGYPSVVQYLLEQGFFREFSRDEFKTILESTDLIQKLSSNSKVLSSLLNNILQKFPTMTESIILQILNLPNREDIVLSIINSFLFTTKKSFADFCDLNPFDVAIVTLFDEKLFDFLTLEEQKDIIQKIHKRDLFLFIEKFSRNYAHPRSSTIKISKQTYSYVYLIILRAIRGTPLMDDLLMKISHRIGVIGPMLKAIQELRKTDEIYWTNIFASFLKLWGEIKEKELLSFVSKDTLPKLVSKKTIEILTASLGVLKEDELIEELEKEIKKDRCDKCGEALPLEALRILILKKVVYCPTCGTLIRKIPRFLI